MLLNTLASGIYFFLFPCNMSMCYCQRKEVERRNETESRMDREKEYMNQVRKWTGSQDHIVIKTR